jgi:hypothetical protein
MDRYLNSHFLKRRREKDPFDKKVDNLCEITNKMLLSIILQWNFVILLLSYMDDIHFDYRIKYQVVYY